MENNQEWQRALERAMRALTLRAHSEKEIVDKLARAGFDERVTAQAMAKLYEYRLIDDEAFARQWAESRAGRGSGPWRIKQELRQKGIDAEIIEAVIEDLDEDDALELAVDLAEKHLRRGDKNAKKRAYDAMIRRGYGFDFARQALDIAVENVRREEEEEEDGED